MNTNTEYKILNYNDLLTSMKALAAAYPDYVSMFTSQERYKLTSAGGYSNHIMIVEDTRRYQTKQSDGHRQKARNSLPEVFLSGALHGNERVGPTAVFETVRLLVLAAACHGTDRRTDACEELRVHDGGAPWAGPWLARLVSTRRIVAVPMANAAGYAKGRREEEDFDPNRDFSYDQNPDLCMRTICGRTINEVWLESLFQLSLTFHSGIELIGWAWGSTNRPIKQGRSPDDEGQKELTHGIVDYGGNFQGSPKYRNGSINDGIIYAVKGGFEEWAYAASWDKGATTTCTPKSYGGYPESKTIYNNSTHRSFNLLVETSNSKTPTTNLGTRNGLFNPGDTGNGHLPRNIRVALMNVELVEPYVSIRTVNSNRTRSDVRTGKKLRKRWCLDKSTKTIDHNHSSSVEIEWTVGGSFQVNETRLIYALWSNVPAVIGCVTRQRTERRYVNFLQRDGVYATTVEQGVTRWSDPEKFDGGGASPDTVFKGTIDMSGFRKWDRVAVFAVAKVDQGWGEQEGKVQPDVDPQTHVVNARTNPDWNHKIDNGKFVRGRLHWMSVPIIISFSQDV